VSAITIVWLVGILPAAIAGTIGHKIAMPEESGFAGGFAGITLGIAWPVVVIAAIIAAGCLAMNAIAKLILRAVGY
jgi:hypothetical protein